MIKETRHQTETKLPGSREIAALREHFPACFKEDGFFDMERFRELLSGKLPFARESYGLKFPGKDYARLLASLATATVIVPDEEHNTRPENAGSENIYISGDNLDGLKHLLKSYARSVKCIYIDPPYNTGSDGFVYNDTFNFSAKELSEKLSIGEEQARCVLDLAKRGSASHSAWLLFIYPRLLLARNLLTDDGVIFISIDDNEQSNLKLLCDDVFGEENFIGVFPRVTKKGGKSSGGTAKNHDYVTAYSKKPDGADLVGLTHDDAGYNNKDAYFGERGYYKANQTLDYNSLRYAASLDYPITIEGETFIPGGDWDRYKRRQKGLHGRADWAWRWSKDLFEFGLRNGFIEIHRGGARPRIYTKTYQKVTIKKSGEQYRVVAIDRIKPMSTLEFTGNKYSNDNAKKALELVMPKGVFEYTKPPALIAQLIRLVNGDGFIVLDFFSGSGTTAQAVLELAAQDEKNCTFIQVQLKEPVKPGSIAANAGYGTIDEIGRERIIRAAKAIREENPHMASLDLGFKHYTLAAPSWNTPERPEAFDPSDHSSAAPGLLAGFGKTAVLATWMNHDGYGLAARPQEIVFEGCPGYFIGKHLYLPDERLTGEVIVSILVKIEADGAFYPENVVFLGYNFPQAEREALQTRLSCLKNLRVSLDIRY
ncbi:MAG TPA: restriction endonuclease subunit M [Clostridiales bacterium]|nr:restriction endonuclease subunit M [Clostridiales bacterium]